MHASRALRHVPTRRMSCLPKRGLLASLRGLVARGVGTFDLPELRSADGLQQAAQQSIEEAVRLIRRAEGEEGPREGSIELVDRVSDTLCRVADVAEALRNVHSDPGWRRAAEGCCGQMGAFLGQLNGYVPLYEVVRGLADDTALRSRLSEEQARFLDAIRMEYEKDGIHLPEAGAGLLGARCDPGADAAVGSLSPRLCPRSCPRPAAEATRSRATARAGGERAAGEWSAVPRRQGRGPPLTHTSPLCTQRLWSCPSPRLLGSSARFHPTRWRPMAPR